MDVSENNFSPQIIHFNRVFHDKPSILGFSPIFGNTHMMMIIAVDVDDEYDFTMKHWGSVSPALRSETQRLRLCE